MSFRYPDSWRSYRYADGVSLFTTLITYLSTSPLHDPCTAKGTRSNHTTVCATPLDRLPPGGALVSWTDFDMLSVTLADQPGDPTSFGGHPARLINRQPHGVCAAVGATHEVRASIARYRPRPRRDLIVMDACLARPGVMKARKQVAAMLESVQIHSDRHGQR